jgi:biopolymer transport protein ExbD
MQNGGDEGPITGVNVTPLVDIILVVLIVFMATAPLIHKRAIKVDVPKAAHHERAATEALQLVYNAKKEILLAGQKLDAEELKDRLSRAAAAQPELHVTLSADRSLAYGEVVGLLDVVRGAGVRKIGLEVVRK